MTGRAICISAALIMVFLLSFYTTIVTSLNCSDISKKIQYNRTNEILTLFPAVNFAFSFEGSVLPVMQNSRVKDYNGSRSYKACFMCLLLTTIYYTIIMGHSYIYGLFVDKQQCNALYSVTIIDLVLFADSNEFVLPNIFALLLVFCFLI